MDRQVSITLTFVDLATGALERTAGMIGTSLGSLAGAATSTFSSLPSIVGGVVGKVGGLVTGLAGKIGGLFSSMFGGASTLSSLFIGPMLIGVGGSLVKVAADAEQTRVAFQTLLRSAPEAGNLMEWLTKYSLVTPLTRTQLEETARTFLAFGQTLAQTKIGVQAVTETTSALGISQDRQQAITENLGKIYQSTTASMRHLNFEMWQGVPVGKLLAEAVNEGSLKLSGFSNGAETAAGASKKLTTAFNSATKSNKYMNDEIKIGEERLKNATSAHKVNQTTVDSARLSLEKLKDTQSANNTTIAQYTVAQGNLGKALGGTSEKLKELTRDQIEAVLKQNEGKNIAIALEEQMLKTFGGAALRQVKTFSGAMSNFADVFHYVVQVAMGVTLQGDVVAGGFFDKIRNAAANLIEYLTNHVDTITNFANKFLTAKGTMTAFASFAVGILIPAITGIVAPLLILGAKWILVGLAIQKFIEMTGGMEAWKTRIVTAFDFIKAKLDEFKGKWSEIKDKIDSVIDPIANKIQGLKNLLVFGSIASPIPASWGEVFKTVGEDLKIVAHILLGVLKPAWDSLKQALKDLNPLMKQWGELLKLWGPALLLFATGVLVVALALLTGFLTALSQLVSGVVLFVTGIVQIFTGLFKIIVGIFSFNGELIKQGFHELWDGIHNIVLGFVNMTLGTIWGFIKGIIQFFTNLYDVLVGKSIIPDLINAIVQWFASLPDKIYGLIDNFIKGVCDKFGSMVKSATSWGESLISNFIQGIRSALRNLGGAAKAIADKMGLSDLLKEHGGIVPGPIGAPIPIIAHGGELITPRGTNTMSPFGGGSGGGTTVNINFNGGVMMDSPERVAQLATAIEKVLGRKNELARYGVGY
jgi:hypothetical protein